LIKEKDGKERASALNSYSEFGFPAGDRTAGNYFYFCHSREKNIVACAPTRWESYPSLRCIRNESTHTFYCHAVRNYSNDARAAMRRNNFLKLLSTFYMHTHRLFNRTLYYLVYLIFLILTV